MENTNVWKVSKLHHTCQFFFTECQHKISSLHGKRVVMFPFHFNTTEVRLQEYNSGRIQNGDWNTDADCMSSGNQGPCGDDGDMLG
jgi:hypothetical protein